MQFANHCLHINVCYSVSGKETQTSIQSTVPNINKNYTLKAAVLRIPFVQKWLYGLEICHDQPIWLNKVIKLNFLFTLTHFASIKKPNMVCRCLRSYYTISVVYEGSCNTFLNSFWYYAMYKLGKEWIQMTSITKICKSMHSMCI